MYISLNLVLEHLSLYNCQSYIDSRKTLSFDRLCLLPECAEDFSLRHLYVGELSLALSLRKLGKRFYCVCIRDREPEDSGQEEAFSGLLVIDENVSLRKVYTRLQDLFCMVMDWVTSMHRYAYEKRPIQEILELSEPVIGNFISVSDSALNLVCHTSHIPTDDPLCTRLLANGFHPEESIAAFSEHGLFDLWDKAEGLIINTSHELSPYDLCSKVFKLHNTYFIHIVMTCNNHPLTPGIIDLFQILANTLDIYVKRDWQQNSLFLHDYDSFLIELIEGAAGSPSIVAKRAKHLNLPLTGQYQLCLIEFKALDQLPVGLIGIELSRKFPNARVTIYQNRLLLLLGGAKEREEEADLIPREQLNDWLEKFEASCAVSCVFETLPDIRLAYEQTQLVFKYHFFLPQTGFERLNAHSRIADYENCFLLSLLGENPVSRSVWQTTKSCRMLKKICDYDEKHGSNNIQLLYTYLFCDCRATEASAILHMHRNNVLYRIGRIEEILGAELSDQKVKYGLFCAYPLYLLYGE